MIQDRRSNRAKPNRPPDRSVDVWATRPMSTPTQNQNAKLQATLTARRPDWRGEWLLAVAQNVPMLHRQNIRRHSMPIARALGGAV
jgi:hypothetical protein